MAETSARKAEPSRKPRLARLAPWLLAVFSGLFLWGAYAPWNQSENAWFALAPLIAVLRIATPRKGFFLGWLAGAAFWLPSLAWLWRLTDNGGPWPLVVLGHLGLSLYCALYWGLFGCLTAALWTTSGSRNGVWPDLGRATVAALGWAGLELVRSTFLTGFAWNHVGVSQVSNLAIIQLASVGGVGMVSALIVWLNATLANVGVRVWLAVRGRQPVRRHWDLMVVLGCVVAVFLWGARELRRWAGLESAGPFLSVAAVQPEAPSIFERDDAALQAVADRLAENTARVAAFRPDVVLWPETVLFGAIPQDTASMDFATENARRSKAPVLAGAVEVEPVPEGDRPVVANASWLFEPDGTVSGRYRKQHLVPFGEFIPLDGVFPILERLSPVGFSCTPGRDSALLTIPMRGGMAAPATPPGADPSVAVLSPLICFEDTVASLARKAVRKGAGVLVNQSNDAWFSGSCEAAQHHAQAVFRAIENRTPLVRCANAGVSAMVGPTGRSSEAAEYFVVPVTPRQAHWPLSPYTRWGEWGFGIPCLVVLATAALGLRRRAVPCRDPGERAG